MSTGSDSEFETDFIRAGENNACKFLAATTEHHHNTAPGSVYPTSAEAKKMRLYERAARRIAAKQRSNLERGIVPADYYWGGSDEAHQRSARQGPGPGQDARPSRRPNASGRSGTGGSADGGAGTEPRTGRWSGRTRRLSGAPTARRSRGARAAGRALRFAGADAGLWPALLSAPAEALFAETLRPLPGAEPGARRGGSTAQQRRARLLERARGRRRPPWTGGIRSRHVFGAASSQAGAATPEESGGRSHPLAERPFRREG